MALSPYSLLTVAEAKEHLVITSTGQDGAIETVCNDTTDALERYLRRQIVTRGSLVEYHTMRVDGRDLWLSELRPLQWPIISVTEIKEDPNYPRTYPASTLLVVGTDYEISKAVPRDFIRRISSGSVTSWGVSGTRTIRLTYSGGYATTAAVPSHIKLQAKRYAALLWREIDRKLQGISGQSDAMGNFSRFGPAKITDDMADALKDERRMDLFETGEAA